MTLLINFLNKIIILMFSLKNPILLSFFYKIWESKSNLKRRSISIFLKLYLYKAALITISVFLTIPGLAENIGVKFPIIVFPFENLSGKKVPMIDIRTLFIQRLKEKGFKIIGDDVLEEFLSRHRIRYTGGIDEETAEELKREIDAEGVVIVSLEHFSEVNPPKIALTARLVSTGNNPVILWIDGIGLAGDDSPKLLGLGLIEDPMILVRRSIDFLSQSLERFFSKVEVKEDFKNIKKRFMPKNFYRSDFFDKKRKYKIAMLPFFNYSERRNAGEILLLQFVRNMHRFSNFEVIEPGIVRSNLLKLRIIMQDGISPLLLNPLFNNLDTDLIISGKVIDYKDYQGVYGKPKVDFFVQIFERESKKVVWSSNSFNEGDEGILFFDFGRINTAHLMASQMVLAVLEMIAK